MLKNTYFYEKCKNRLGVGGFDPETPLASGVWGQSPQTSTLLLQPIVTTLSSSFLALNAFYYLKKNNNCSKCSAFASFALLHLFFTSNSVVFVDRGRKNVSCSRAQSKLATPLALGLGAGLGNRLN